MEWEPRNPLRLAVAKAGITTLQTLMETDFNDVPSMTYGLLSAPDADGNVTETETDLTSAEKNLLRVSVAFAIARTTNPPDGREPGRFDWYRCNGDDFDDFRTGNSGYSPTTAWS